MLLLGTTAQFKEVLFPIEKNNTGHILLIMSLNISSIGPSHLAGQILAAHGLYSHFMLLKDTELRQRRGIGCAYPASFETPSYLAAIQYMAWNVARLAGPSTDEISSAVKVAATALRYQVADWVITSGETERHMDQGVDLSDPFYEPERRLLDLSNRYKAAVAREVDSPGDNSARASETIEREIGLVLKEQRERLKEVEPLLRRAFKSRSRHAASPMHAEDEPDQRHGGLGS